MISSLGYLRIESAGVGAWREFGVKVLGMTEGRGPEDGAVYLRMDDFPARLVILPGSSERLLASGWETADAAALAAVGRALADAGVAYKAGTAEEVAARRVTSMLSLEDPAGHLLEVFCGAALDSRPRSARTGTASSPATWAWATSCFRSRPARRRRSTSTPRSSGSGCATRCGCRPSW
jgi:3,4-dihydroxy-9,10-secoandrosta-1,3,5(10)-triene-9,17-dione 4,5-dioxygenase